MFETIKTMFSNIGNIAGQKPRETEQSDTRLGIRRHEPDQERRRKKERESDGAGPFDAEDRATVSVEALRLFLQNFLLTLEESKSRQEKAGPQHEAQQKPLPQTQQEPQQKLPDTPVHGDVAQAAGAYRHAGETVKAQHDLSPEAAGAMAQSFTASLPAGEIRTIHRLLADLKILSERKIEYLRIERSDSFLHSLEDAVAKIKTTS